ncbi:MAG: FAD-binding oxidoreductase [Anaeromicrobium sp.]|uniref:NAD(P)/FAD-dependent oxidoreductase n=1 Tax=Anaeromicrobium sp. TaxID=1929132 RepID=UPI0025D76B00|nr:FAD-dependent oxidoreductase [Anaeromicrobium sp.]MCT4594817.1 FAD-binding oxidoreductase [Anaeromicrobium sp.]
MNIVTGDRYWINRREIPKRYSYLHKDIKTDVLILGGGITGSLCFYYFNKNKIDTTLIDKNIIGYMATSASTSILDYSMDINMIGVRGLIGEKNAAKAFRLTRESIDHIEKIIRDDLNSHCGFMKKDLLYYTDNKSYYNMFNKECDLRKKHGFNVEFLEDNGNKFDFNIKSAIYCKDDTAVLDPYELSHELLAYGVKSGGRVFENTQGIHVKPLKNKVIIHTKNGFKIEAKKVIVATGYEGRDHIRERIVRLARSFTIVTKPIKNPEGWYNLCNIRDDNNPYIYIRSTEDNRMIVGGEDLALGGIRSKMTNLKQEDKVSFMKYESLEKKVKKMFPRIKDLQMEYGFSGFFGETKDGLPYIGTYDDPNIYYCLGYGSNGILYGEFGARLLLELYKGKENPHMELFRFRR